MENDQAKEGRRQHPRYPLSQAVAFEVSAPLTFQAPPQVKAEGNTENVSQGGICLITERSLEESQIIKIKLPIPNVVATTPTLAEVRWVKRRPLQQLLNTHPSGGHVAPRSSNAKPQGDHYLVGLRFLF